MVRRYPLTNAIAIRPNDAVARVVDIGAAVFIYLLSSDDVL